MKKHISLEGRERERSSRARKSVPNPILTDTTHVGEEGGHIFYFLTNVIDSLCVFVSVGVCVMPVIECVHGCADSSF